jgi:hypothetical protein
MLLAIKIDYEHLRRTWLTIDNELHQGDNILKYIYSTDATQIGHSITVETRNGKTVWMK